MYREEEEKKYYAVKNGRKTGIFETWAECKEQVHGFKGCKFKSFPSYEEAEEYLFGESSSNSTTDEQIQFDDIKNVKTENKEPVLKNVAIYVVGKPETKYDPSMYITVLECDNKYKLIERSFIENASPTQLTIEGIIDSISAVKKPCYIRVYSTSAIEIEKRRGRNTDLIDALKNLIQERGHIVEFEKNTKLVKKMIEEIRLKQAV